MKLFSVSIKVACQNTGRRYLLTVDVVAKHECEARTMAMSDLSDKDLLMDVNILTVDIIELLNRVNVVSVKEVAK
jgi:hypothetical protein